jgi:hypothetical protein
MNPSPANTSKNDDGTETIIIIKDKGERLAVVESPEKLCLEE